MASEPHTLKKWYKALVTENCCEVKKFLEADERFLHEGWKEDEEAWKPDEQAWVQLKLQRAWKGRTALHVAARRGDVQLIGQILELISCNETHHAMGGDEGAYSGSANCRLLKLIDGEYGLDALAMAVVNGNQAIVKLLKKASLRCELNPFDISRDPDDHEENEHEENKAAVSRKTISQSSEGETSPDQNKVEVSGSHSSVGRPSLDQNGVDISHDAEKGLVLDENGEIMVEGNQNWANMVALSKITKELLKKSGSFRQAIEELYYNDCDFNFLEISVYLFLFTFSTWKSTRRLERLIRPIRKGIFLAVKERIYLVKYLLFKLKDGQGRTALHVAVDSSYHKVNIFLNVIPRKGQDQDLNYDYLNIADSAGRTPIYRAATKASYFAVRRLLGDSRTYVTAEITYYAHKWGADLDLDKLSWRNGFKSDSVYIPDKKLLSDGFNNKINAPGEPGPFVSSTALHVAIMHKHDLIVQQLLENDPTFSPAERKMRGRSLRELSDNDAHDDDFKLSENDYYDDDSESIPILRRSKEDYLRCYRWFTWPILDFETYRVQRFVSAMKLTVLVGDTSIFQRLLKYQEEQQKKHLDSVSVPQSVEDGSTSFQLAAATGNPDIIKAFLDTPDYDPLIQDMDGNTLLHYAVKGKYFKFHPHLVDFVGCQHVLNSRLEAALLADAQDTNQVRQDMERHEKSETQKRIGCINLLLLAGIDIWKHNKDHKVPSPYSNAPEELLAWWYNKVAEEIKQALEKLNAGANAISVTAALVATASYVGPFEPPLGYDADSVQVESLAVKIFVVCDSLSFYFALAAIMFSLLPSLPTPEKSKFKQLVKTRIQVAVALVCLLPSIVCVLMAFAAGYIAVIPDHGLSHDRGRLTVSTAVVGGFLCLIAVVQFAVRLVNELLTLSQDVSILREVLFDKVLYTIKKF